MKGLAKDIAGQAQAGERSEEYDLAGFDGASAAELVSEAFGKALPGPKPIKCTFIVGGGKKVRTKYPDDLPTSLERALKSVGYNEDRGASLSDPESVGTFKWSHDTGRDLKYISVIAHVDPSSAPSSTHGSNQSHEEHSDELSIEEKVAFCSADKLKRLVHKKVIGLSARRKLHKHLKSVQSQVESAEQKLSRLESLSEKERDAYENSTELHEKLTWLNGEMERMISNGELTPSEKAELESSFDSKRNELSEQVDKAKAESRPHEKKQKQLDELVSKLEGLKATTPRDREIKGEAELVDCMKQLKRLEELEKSRELQSLQTIQELKRKPELESRIKELREANIGWFESSDWLDEQLQREVRKSESKKQPQKQQATNGAGKGGAGKPQQSQRRGTHSNSFAGLI